MLRAMHEVIDTYNMQEWRKDFTLTVLYEVF